MCKLLLFPILLVYFVCSISEQASRGDTCQTPNSETARCVPISQCSVITNAISTRNKTATDFARKSQCGYDSVVLVCCGSTGYPIKSNPPISQKKTKIKPYIHNNLPHSSVCGIERNDHRIYGGHTTDLDEFPWTVLLRYTSEDDYQDAGFRCGGTLINHKYVLTAAHCMVLLPGVILSSVRLGEWRLSTAIDCLGETRARECAEPVVNVEVDNTLPHPQYNKRMHVNDIGLVRLKQNVKYTDFIRPICLPPPNSQDPEPGSKVVAVGWGATENGERSDVKLKVQLSTISTQNCTTIMRQYTQITERHFCAGGAKGKDSCQGDSGGPLMVMVENDVVSQPQWFQEGIISWGIGCGVDGYPGVYTKVSSFTNWIINNMAFDN